MVDLRCLKSIIALLLLFVTCTAFAQEKTVQGIIFDKDSKARLTRVYLYNMRTHSGFYNNTKGEFNTKAVVGDTLVAALQGYNVDTLIVPPANTVLFYLKRNSILLQEVKVTDSLLSPQERLNRTRKEYSGIYRKGDPQDLLQRGTPNRPGGAGLGIDALYSLLSREGKNARYLQEIIERDYKDNLINYRYTPALVSSVTGLKGEKLKDFMEQYRPSYYFILEAKDYGLISFIKDAFRQYTMNPALNRLPPLVPEYK